MTTEAAKRAAEALNKRREAEGLKRVTVWLSKEARFKLDALKAAAGSKDKAADAAILAWAGRVPEKLGKPSAGRKAGLAKGSEPKATPSLDLHLPRAPDIKSGDTYTVAGDQTVHVAHVIQHGPTRAKFGERQKTGKAKR